MKRTATTVALWMLGSIAPGLAQEPAGKTQVNTLQDLVTKMKEVEAAAKSVVLEMRTKGSFPGGLTFETRGSIRVLKTEHLRVHTRMEFHSGDGIQGSEESVRTEEGVWTLKHDPVFGEVFLHMDADLMRDLEWAGQVLGRDAGVPGAVDRSDGSPLGSGLIEELARQYDLGELRREVRDGQEGFWIGGDLKAEFAPETEPDMPVPDRVEVFVRARDAAVLEMVHFKDGKPILEIEVTRLELNRPIEASSFVLDVGDREPKDVREYPPDWAQIQQTLQEAEEKSGEKRPSRR